MRPHPLLALLADVILVVAFVSIGRLSHREDPVEGAWVTIWPFLVGLAIGWLVARAWRRPIAVVSTGVVVWAVTVVLAMVLRLVSGQGVEVAFVVVASVVLGVFLIGWRALATLERRIRAGRRR